ncbi:hypothetical protein M0R04_01710 [Candidatus Dojkabacteria bacterium]|jgi:hypothetical protein|nr:hypothetical protein [Candidatus Dojkabacteria bacterium]
MRFNPFTRYLNSVNAYYHGDKYYRVPGLEGAVLRRIRKDNREVEYLDCNIDALYLGNELIGVLLQTRHKSTYLEVRRGGLGEINPIVHSEDESIRPVLVPVRVGFLEEVSPEVSKEASFDILMYGTQIINIETTIDPSKIEFAN